MSIEPSETVTERSVLSFHAAIVGGMSKGRYFRRV